MSSPFQNLMRSTGMISATFSQEMMQWVLGSICNLRSPREDICLRTTYMLVGEDYEQNDEVRQTKVRCRVAETSPRNKYKNSRQGLRYCFSHSLRNEGT